MTEFKVLGGFEVTDGGHDFTPSAPKLRQVLAALVLHASQVVHTDLLIEELWGDDPPKSATTTVRTYMYHLREGFARQPAANMLVTRQPGYLLRIEPHRIDLNIFQQLAQQGRNELAHGRPGEASQFLRKALDLWTGPALVDVNHGPVLRARVVALEELRLHALELRIQADFALGLHRGVIGELRSLVVQHPLNEWFRARLIDALGRAGRRNEALDAYMDLRNVMNTELGLEPGPELQRLQRQLLTAGHLPAEIPAVAAG